MSVSLSVNRAMVLIAALLIGVLLAGCAPQSQPITPRETGALIGAASGAALGAVVGAPLGGPGVGAIVGGVLGVVSGAVIGNEVQNQEGNGGESQALLRQQAQSVVRQRGPSQ